MSQRSPALERLLPEIARKIDRLTAGISFANDGCHVLALVAGGALALWLSGCLVTDTVELPVEPQTPPVITSVDYPVGSIILFNGKNAGQLIIPMQVRN